MAAIVMTSTSALAILSMPAAAVLAYAPFVVRPLFVLQAGLPYDHAMPVRQQGHGNRSRRLAAEFSHGPPPRLPRRQLAFGRLAAEW